jgi:hypothetical protein
MVLISFKIRNFLSIRDEVVIKLEASSNKELMRNVAKNKHRGLLKSIGVYGANATGKSNIIKAFYFVWQLTKSSHSYNIETKIQSTQFKLSDKSRREPSSFEITFTKNDFTYQYGFSCLDSKITDEYLYRWDDTYDKPSKSEIFVRRNTNDYTFRSEAQKQQLIKSQVTENVLYLSRATALNFEKVRDAYEFIVNDLVITFNNPWDPWNDYTKVSMINNSELKNKVVDILQKADFGGITDISIEKKRGKGARFEVNFSKEGVKLNPTPMVDIDTYIAKFLHKISTGEVVEFAEQEESAGTLKMFSFLGPILDILENGKVLIIDELETSLHPSISEFIVRLFHSKLNKRNAQLLFVTHNTNLLTRNVLRRDQIYITGREPNEGTEIFPLSDFKLREGMDFERVYLAGRVGGLPFIDETILD